MKYKLTILVASLLVMSCNSKKEETPQAEPVTLIKTETVPVLNLEEANRLAQLPLHCMDIEYPNKLNQTIGSSADLQSPKTLHRRERKSLKNGEGTKS